MTRIPILPLIAVLAIHSLSARAATWSVEPDESRISFQATQQGGAFEGRFRRFDAKIRFDPDDLASSRIKVEVDVTSITTGSPDRDGELPKPDWFDIARFPRAVFEADRFEKTRDGYLAEGSLVLRDIRQPILLPFTLEIAGGLATVRGHVELDRTAFGIGQGWWATTDMVGKQVVVLVSLVAKREL